METIKTPIVLQLQTFPACGLSSDTALKRYRKEILKVGSFIKDATKQAFEVTTEVLDHFVKTFESWTGNGNRVSIPLGHSSAGQPEKNQGWVVSMFREGTSLYGIMEILDEALALTTDVSVYIQAEAIDGKGVKYTLPITHIALCTDPVIPGLEKFIELSLSKDIKMDKKALAKLLGIAEDSSDELVLSTITKLKSVPAVKQTVKTDPVVVQLVSENRSIKLGGLLEAGLITPAVKDAINARYVSQDVLALTAGAEDGFDFLLQVLTDNKTVSLGEKTGAQLLELSNSRAKGAKNPIEADVNRRRTAAGLKD